MIPITKVLIVENDAQDVDDALKVFGKVQCSPTVFRNGREARNFLAETTEMPDLVLLGLRVPEVDGLQLLRWMRSVRKRNPYVFSF